MIYPKIYPKSIGLLIHGNDLIISIASQKFLKSSYESTVVEDFLLKESLDLKLIIDAYGFQTNNIILSWPRERTIVREIELPESNIKELKESLSYQLDSFILFPEDNFSMFLSTCLFSTSVITGELFIKFLIKIFNEIILSNDDLEEILEKYE